MSVDQALGLSDAHNWCSVLTGLSCLKLATWPRCVESGEIQQHHSNNNSM